MREYEGDIAGKLKIGLTLRLGPDGKSASGCYFYYKYCQDIRIDASITGRSILIREFDRGGKPTGLFTGRFLTTDPRHQFKGLGADNLQTEVIEGTWSRPDGSKPLPFHLSEVYLEHWPGGTPRYANAGFANDAVVDRFAAQFRVAILDGNAAQAARMIRFPIDLTIEGKKQTIDGPADFRRDFNKIFLPGFVERLRNSAPFHMFSRDEGVMFGDCGEVWIAPAAVTGQAAPIVDAINNDLVTARH
jgi:hypothetical protein